MKFQVGQKVIVYGVGKGKECEIIATYKTKHHGMQYRLHPAPDPRWDWYDESLCAAVNPLTVEILEIE